MFYAEETNTSENIMFYTGGMNTPEKTFPILSSKQTRSGSHTGQQISQGETNV